ncbi:MAG TPA: type II toxin-antitoxin system RelE/ParE family toxin [Candidatus Lokiarchaeia archaeon]|nr:type II toxin-antitoxin system RelE/ParE family toxin [Candidatus Lokiarchaeia archaeon]
MKINWTKPALADLDSIYDYIKRDSEFYADRFVGKILEAIDRLVKLPEMGRIIPEANQEDLRELILRNYRIMYRFNRDNKMITILAIIHGSRNLHKHPRPWEIE